MAPGVVREASTVPTVRRIIVGVHGSPGSLQALRFAADEARQRDVPLLAITAWVPPGGDVAERRHPAPSLRKLWRDAGREGGAAIRPPPCASSGERRRGSGCGPLSTPGWAACPPTSKSSPRRSAAT